MRETNNIQKTPPSQKQITETREQTLKKIEYYLPTLTDSELRMVSGLIRGIQKSRET